MEKHEAISLFKTVCSQMPRETRIENFKWQWFKNVLEVFNTAMRIRIEQKRPAIFELTNQEYGELAKIYNS